MEKVNVLVLGNNPTELSAVFDILKKVKHWPVRAEYAFDLPGTLQALGRFKPNYILIDDNIGRQKLRLAVEQLMHHRKTKTFPLR
jgi:hypothetical protein